MKLKGHAIAKSDSQGAAASIAVIMAEELDDFANAVQTGSPPAATARDAMKSIALIERCYNNPNLLEFPWMLPVELPDELTAESGGKS